MLWRELGGACRESKAGSIVSLCKGSPVDVCRHEGALLHM